MNFWRIVEKSGPLTAGAALCLPHPALEMLTTIPFTIIKKDLPFKIYVIRMLPITPSGVSGPIPDLILSLLSD